jgi:peptide subunit release factor 1 (eRF1)
MDLRGTLERLSKIRGAPAPVVSVYLNTHWADEHQRDRVRVFLKNEVRKARETRGPRASTADLDWIQEQGEALIGQRRFPEAQGVALFACEVLGLREVLPVRVPFEDSFTLSEAPVLGPLAAALESAPEALVVFVDAESARLISLAPDGNGEEITVTTEGPSHPRPEGWPQRAYSHYRRNILDMRRPHFDAVAESLVGLARDSGVRRLVLAGEPRNVAGLTKALPPSLAASVVGTVSGTRYEPAAVMADRAVTLLARVETQRAADEVDALLTEAAKGGQASAGVETTLEAINRGAVHRLYLLKGFAEAGRVCSGCGALQRGTAATCRLCGQTTKGVELGEAMADRALGAGGSVQRIDVHAALMRAGGVAARLRYPL